MTPLRDILEFAVESAQVAGAFTLGYFNASTPVEWKADRSPVTAADRGAEERIRARIEKHCPSHGILGEEFGEKPATDGRARWILDPIDGTYSFIHGVPLYSTLIGYEYDGEMLAGVIHMPALGETVWLVPGHCDPTVNLHEHLVAVRGGLDNGVVEAVWTIDARGRLD